MADRLEFYASTRPIKVNFDSVVTEISDTGAGYKVVFENGAFQHLTYAEGINLAVGQTVTAGQVISLNDGTIDYAKRLPKYGMDTLFKSVEGYRLELTGVLNDYRKLWVKFVDYDFELYRLECFINFETPSPYDTIFLSLCRPEDNESYLLSHLSEYEWVRPLDSNNTLLLKENVAFGEEVPLWIKRVINVPAQTYLNNRFEIGFKLAGFYKE
jgi:hypothetical protein